MRTPRSRSIPLTALLATLVLLPACEPPPPRASSDVPVDTLTPARGHPLPADSAAPLLRVQQSPEALQRGLPTFADATDTVVGTPHYAGMLDDGRLVFLSAERVSTRASSPARGQRTLFALHPQSGAADSLATVDGGLWRVDADGVSPFEFGAPAVAAARGSRIVFGSASRFELSAVDPNGEVLATIHADVPAAPVTPILRTAHEHAQGDSAVSPRPDRAYPQWLPAYRSVVLAQSGEAWVEHYRPEVDTRARAWAVFDRDGTLLRWVSVPAEARIVDATTSHIFVAVSRPDGVRVTAHER